MIQPTHGEIQRDLGRMEGKADAMGARLDRLEKIVTDGFDKIDERLARIEKTESERKGAWKVIVTVAGGVAGGVSAAVAVLIKYLTA